MKFHLSASLAALLFAVLPLRADLSQREMNNGYALLHSLCDEETQVDMIMMVKTTPPDVARLAKEISKSAKEDMATLDDMADHDPAIHFGQNGLPKIETQTRGSIKDQKQDLLVFKTKGSDFAKTLVLTQIEASTYGENMAKVMADDETDPHRAEALRHIASRWATIKNKAYALLYKM
jgi:hypothetical protein